MKLTVFISIFIALLLAACSTSASDGDVALLRVTDDTIERNFSVSDLEKMPTTEAIFNDLTYVGVRLQTVLEEAGLAPDELSAVKASASDGYSVNYDPVLFLREDVIVAYATAEGSLIEEDGTFRMVLPGEEGKLNIRFLVELKAIP